LTSLRTTKSVVAVTITVATSVVTIAIEAGATLLTLTRCEVSATREAGGRVTCDEAYAECCTECDNATGDDRAHFEGLGVTSGLLAHRALYLVLDVRRGDVCG
jgi:hypothetical protein